MSWRAGKLGGVVLITVSCFRAENPVQASTDLLWELAKGHPNRPQRALPPSSDRPVAPKPREKADSKGLENTLFDNFAKQFAMYYACQNTDADWYIKRCFEQLKNSIAKTPGLREITFDDGDLLKKIYAYLDKKSLSASSKKYLAQNAEFTIKLSADLLRARANSSLASKWDKPLGGSGGFLRIAGMREEDQMWNAVRDNKLFSIPMPEARGRDLCNPKVATKATLVAARDRASHVVSQRLSFGAQVSPSALTARAPATTATPRKPPDPATTSSPEGSASGHAPVDGNTDSGTSPRTPPATTPTTDPTTTATAGTTDNPTSTSAGTQDFNATVLQALHDMPQGGKYSVHSDASNALTSAISAANGQLQIDASKATPSYCSSATYLVFLKTLQNLQDQGKIHLSPAAIKALGTKPSGEWLADGHGVWGRWNANGLGTAELFKELKLGPSFYDDYSKAKPGDFMKILWNDSVGNVKSEGHSVVFTGVKKDAQGAVTEVCFWSSNSSTNGYGEKCVPKTKIVHSVFSRLTLPGNAETAASLPDNNRYLAGLLTKRDSFQGALANISRTASVSGGSR